MFLHRIMVLIISERLAMFLLRCGLTLFLTLNLTPVHGSKIQLFTTRPKNKEIFVGDSVTFDWDYRKEEDIVAVRFGIVSNTSEGTTKDLTLFLKKPNEVSYVNTRVPKFIELVRRIEFVEGKRASFKISNVRMNNTGKYFCMLRKRDEIKTDTKHVELKVVDLQIDEKTSTSEEESWKNQKILLVCTVRVVDGEPVTFTWLRQPNNRTLSRGMHIDSRTESILTIITSSDYHFTTYTCVAKTKRTTKLHNVVVKRLYGPGPPLNLQQEFIFDKEKGESYHKVYWSAPKNNGGAKVTDYIIEYKPRGIDWSKATRAITTKTMFDRFKLKEGKVYDVRVLAKNKVDEGGYSNEVEIKLSGGYPSTGARSNSSNIHYSTWWSYLLTLTLLVTKPKW